MLEDKIEQLEHAKKCYLRDFRTRAHGYCAKEFWITSSFEAQGLAEEAG